MKVWIVYQIGTKSEYLNWFKAIHSTEEDAKYELDRQKRRIYEKKLAYPSGYAFDEAMKKAEEEFQNYRIKEIELD